MKYFLWVSIILIISVSIAITAAVPISDLTQDEIKEMNTFVADLMGRMTLSEKLGQLNQEAVSEGIVTGTTMNSGVDAKVRQGLVGSTFGVIGKNVLGALQRIAVEDTRLGIPLLFALDVIHGHRSVYPIPLGLANSWDMDMMKESARIAAIESLNDGIQWVFSPMIDIVRDARWGRVAESNGEDPFLGSAIATAMVQGYQQDRLDNETSVAACFKHFALYGGAEAGRDYNTVDMSLQTMYNTYLKPYHAAVEAGAATLMTSFNTVNNVPATANKWLLTDLLRTQWGFEGLAVSDYTSVLELINHGIGKDLEDVSIAAINAGLDMDMVAEGLLGLENAVKAGRLTTDPIDQACRRVLELKWKLGLFKNPYAHVTPPSELHHECAAAQDMINTIEPQHKMPQDLLSHKRTSVHSSRLADPPTPPTHREFARKIARDSFVLLKNDGKVLPLDPTSFSPTNKLAVIGPLAADVRNTLGTWAVGGNPYVSVSVVTGLTTQLGEDSLVYAKGANISDDPDFARKPNCFGNGDEITIDDSKTILDEALALVQRDDVNKIVLVMGEAADMSGESASRTNIHLPDAQLNLLQAILDLKLGKDIIIVLFNGRPLAIPFESENFPAILACFSGGIESGNAIADVLLGVQSPNAKLAMSWPRHVGQLPLYYAQLPTGRPAANVWNKFQSNYLDVPNTPLYPFGHGLTYSTFEYSNLKCNNTRPVGENDVVRLTVTVSNTGTVDTKEIVQLYIRDPIASMSRPLKELKGFQKVAIPAGQAVEVNFDITTHELKFYNNELYFDWESGDFQFYISPSSDLTQALRIDVVWVK
jgi:beta-glucosidase